MWWFLPPDTKRPPKINPCQFLTNESTWPSTMKTTGQEEQPIIISVLQQPGDTIYVPKGWYHATCALDDWTVGVGMQRGHPNKYQQKFVPLPQPYVITTWNPERWKFIMMKPDVPTSRFIMNFQRYNNRLTHIINLMYPPRDDDQSHEYRRG